MTLKDKLQQLATEWSTLQTKIKTKLATNTQIITETNQKLTESNRKLELQMKENSENEKILEKLIKEFQELGRSL
jgi:septal ring factor EnvC (AmiA/AmiB activator)